MSNNILQVNYKFSLSVEEMEAAANKRAETIANTVDGLEWKMFFINKSNHETAGLYLFSDEQKLNDYLEGPLFTALENNPKVSDISVKKFSNIAEATAIARGPI